MSEQGLTVKELREKLAEYPDDMEVFVDGYEGGVDSLLASNVVKRQIKSNMTQDGEELWWGRHEIIQHWHDEDADCEGVVLSR